MNNNINVGWGPVTWQGLLATVIWGLGAAATFLSTMAGALPQDKGVMLTTIAGVLSAVSFSITAAARNYFAKYKAGVNPWEEDAPVEDAPTEPTDFPGTDVAPVEPTDG